MIEKVTHWARTTGPLITLLTLSDITWSETKGGLLSDKFAARQDTLSEVQEMYDLTEAQAIKRLNREAEAAELDLKIRNLDIKSYAGSWFDSETWTLKVAVSNPDDVALIERLGGTAVLVSYSLNELQGVRYFVESRLGKNPSTRSAIRKTYIDYQSNQFVIGTAPSQLALVESVLASLGVNVDSVKVIAVAEEISFSTPVRGADSMCNASMVPEYTQTCDDHPCSVGVSVVGGYVTAGHCGESDSVIHTDPPSGSGQLLGKIKGSTMTLVSHFQGYRYKFAYNEDGAWVDTAAGWTPKPKVNGYTYGIFSISAEWAGMLEALVGGTVCRYGQTSGPFMGRSCGEIAKKDVTINKFSVSELNGLTEVSDVCADDGDSGGPYVTLGAQQIQGTHSAVTQGNTCPTPADFVYFQPIRTTLNRFDKTMLTPHGSNPPVINGFNCPSFNSGGNYLCGIDNYLSQGDTDVLWSTNIGDTSTGPLLSGSCTDGQTVSVDLLVTNPYGSASRTDNFVCQGGPPQ